ncbi:MAG: molecular chaperone HtpG, partial [Gammaproteobacteria bacterium]
AKKSSRRRGSSIEAVASEDDADKEEAGNNENPDVLEKVKVALGDDVQDVRASKRLTESPACLVSTEEQMSANLERLLQAAGQEVPNSQRILELNIEHPMVRMIATMDAGEQLKNWSTLLFEQSILAEGGKLDDPAGFVKRMNDMVLELAGPDS